MKCIQIITISSFDREMAAAGSCRKRPLMGQFHFARRRQLFPKHSSQVLRGTTSLLYRWRQHECTGRKPNVTILTAKSESGCLPDPSSKTPYHKSQIKYVCTTLRPEIDSHCYQLKECMHIKLLATANLKFRTSCSSISNFKDEKNYCGKASPITVLQPILLMYPIYHHLL
jgi:hypothetical protein